MFRRELIRTSGLTSAAVLFTALSLTACNPPGTPLTPAQILADAQGVVSLGSTLAAILAMASPTLIPANTQAEVANDLALAKQAIANLTDGMPATASAPTVAQIEGWINDIVSTAAFMAPKIPALAPYAGQIAMAPYILAALEDFAAPYLAPAPAKASAAKKGAIARHGSADDLAAARRALAVPTLSR